MPRLSASPSPPPALTLSLVTIDVVVAVNPPEKKLDGIRDEREDEGKVYA